MDLSAGVYLCETDQHGVNNGESLCILEVYASVSKRDILAPVNYNFTLSGTVGAVKFSKSNATTLYVNCIRLGDYY